MKSKRVRAILATVGVALTLGVSAALGGCTATAGRDGVNGKDLNIYEVYAAAKAETNNPDLTFSDFLKEYFSYTPAEISLQTALNRSLLSAVSVQSQFREYESGIWKSNAYSGSGVIIDVDTEKGDMTVVTNCHVVYSAKANRLAQDGFSDNIHLWLYGSESDYENTYKQNAIPAKLVAASKTYDVAVLKVTGSDIVKNSYARAAEWSQAEEVYLGETVYAIGNANSQKLSANVGCISKDSELIKVDLGDNNDGYQYTVMRTSAAINSGNSGGGLFNIGCEIVGLVNAKGKSDATGFGYALTAASTRRVVESMLDNYADTGAEAHYLNRVKHGITVEVADMYSTGLNASGYTEIVEKVKISGINLGSAASGKLKSDDVLKHIKITGMRKNEDGVEELFEVENMEINREHNFHDAMLSVRAGDMVEITVIRGADEVTQSMMFGSTAFEKVV